MGCCESKASLISLDPSSYSNPQSICYDRMEITWNIDFDTKMISGFILYSLVRKDKRCKSIIFDVKDIRIISISNKKGDELEYYLGDSDEDFGRPLRVVINDFDSEQHSNIRIDYDCSGTTSLQWLVPSQTHDKTHPYMFSQGQAINNRSLLPCQDTPSLKASYCANVSVPEDFLVLMSAIADPKGPVSEEEGRLTYKFEQRFPIASYLIAIAVGKLEGRQVGPRSTVFAEPGVLDKAAEEFSDTEEFLQMAEKCAGPYIWKIYDILVLPPSFPFGGMENPNLTFATPTLLAGDKSLTDVIVHEISHSWTGNLVTNKNYEHFWLNEGFTIYLERLILGKLRGEAYRQFHSLHGLQDLKDTLHHSGMDPSYTKLVNDLTGINPDDVFSVVPYEKGYTFLYYLETVVGKEAFEEYFKEYINCHKFQSIDSKTFKHHFKDYFIAHGKEAKIKVIDWGLWLYSTGMPPHIPEYDHSLEKQCSELAIHWLDWDPLKTKCPFKETDFDHFEIRAGQIQDFLALLLDEERPLTLVKMKAMQKVYKMHEYQNCEIRCLWCRLCIKAKWLDHLDFILKFITEQGRMKYIGPIYRELYAWEQARQKTQDTFKRHHANMMTTSAQKIAKALHLAPQHAKGKEMGYSYE